MAIGGIKTPWKLARSGIKDHLKPIRSLKHQAFVKRQHCCVAVALGTARECEGPMNFCHYKGFKDSGTGQTGGDERGFPACWRHHILVQHNIGEAAFQRRYDIDLKALTLHLARLSPDQRIREKVNG